MSKQGYSKFLKGIHARFNPSAADDPTRLYTLQNARLQKRGETGQVARIEGFSGITNSTASFGASDTIFDALFYDNDFIVLWHHNGSNEIRITFVDIDSGSTDHITFSNAGFTSVSGATGQLTLQENTIFVTVGNHQKVLTNVSGTWHLNDFISTIPTVEIGDFDGEKATTTITIIDDGPESGDPGTEADTDDDLWTVTDAPGGDGSLDIVYPFGEVDAESVNISYLSTDSIEDVVGKVVTAINADGDIQITADSFNAATQVGFTEKRVGTEHNGNIVEIDYPPHGSPDQVTMAGGEDPEVSGEPAGTLRFNIGDDNHIEATVDYDDTKEEIAAKLRTSAGESNCPDFSAAADTDNTIEMEADEIGSEFNQAVSKVQDGVSISTGHPDFSGGDDGSGNLDQNEDYWYKVRHVYRDGHKTKASYPAHVNTELHRGINLTIHAVEDDLDGGWIDIEIFRKKGSEDFFLIDKITPDAAEYEYLDDGRPELRGFTEQNYIWADEVGTEALVRDRLVKANTVYPGIDNDADFDAELQEGLVATDTDIKNGEQGIPYNMQVELYSQVRKDDGVETISKFHKSVISEENDVRLRIKQTVEHGGQFKEIATFAKFVPRQPAEVIPFNSLEIYNANVPSIATEDEVEDDQDRPARPHIFLGYKYIRTNDTLVDAAAIFDEEWNTNPQTPDGSANQWVKDDAAISDADFYTFDLYDAGEHELPYSLYATNKVDEVWLHRLAFYDALKAAISQGKCKLRLTGINEIDGPLSSTRPDNDLIGLEVQVVGLKDTSVGEDQITATGTGNEVIYPPNKNHLYLILENDTPFDDIDNLAMNNGDIKADYEAGSPTDTTHRFEFELIGLEEIDNGVASSNELTDYTLHDYDYRLRLTDYTDFQNDAGVLLFNRNSQSDTEAFFTPEIQGWEKTIQNKFEFYTLNEWNIFLFITTEEDIEDFDDAYPTQLIWSEQFVLGTRINGLRNFTYSNFKTISQNYGPIISLQEINNHLIVFCERGINLINVGETLTQQASGEVFVSSETFLTNDKWILKNVPGIQQRSIVQYENSLLFCDGQDVWMYSGEGALTPQNNITHGRIDFNGDIVSAGIDPENKEYRITDQTQTWAYSLEIGEWMGPYTYTEEVSATYKNKMISVNNGGVVEHNQGNDFDGSAYETLLESVALDLENPVSDKLWRKFLIMVDGEIPAEPDAEVLEFQYGKDFNDKVAKNIFNLAKKQGLYHIGAGSANQNATEIFWGIRTDIEGFVLRAFGFIFINRNRP